MKPQDGQLEPVRQLPFYLLRKSLAEIRAEAERAEPSTDMDGFIDGLKVSPELKVWMKAHHRIDLAGTDFTKQLTPKTWWTFRSSSPPKRAKRQYVGDRLPGTEAPQGRKQTQRQR